MCCFIVELRLDVGFEMDLETDAAVWHSNIDLVLLEN
jgi:hypothetical protein